MSAITKLRAGKMASATIVEPFLGMDRMGWQLRIGRDPEAMEKDHMDPRTAFMRGKRDVIFYLTPILLAPRLLDEYGVTGLYK